MSAETKNLATRVDRAMFRILAFFLIIASVMVAIGVISVRNIRQSIASSDWVNHTHAVILQANGVLSSLRASDSSAFAFVVTGDPRSRVARREALSDMAEHLELADALTRNEPEQHGQVMHLETIAQKRVQFTSELLAARQSGNPDAVRALLATDAGATGLDDVEAAVDRLTNDERELLDERDRAAFVQAQVTRWTVWAGVGVNILVLAGAAWLIADDIRARRRAAKALQDANEMLEQKVLERTAALIEANNRLVIENLERNWLNKSQEHQLRYSQLIINSISDLVFVLTKAMNISRINAAVVDATGFEPQDLINRPFSRVARMVDSGLGPEANWIDPISRAMIEGRDLRDQPALAEDKSGREKRVWLSLFPLRDRDQVVGSVVILRPGSNDL